MGDSLEFLDGEAGVCRIASLGNIMIVAWSARATAPSVEKLDFATQRLAGAYPNGVSVIHLIANNAGIPGPETRNRFIKIMNEQTKAIACVAIVVGGVGFWASAMRSFITGLRFMTPRSFDLRLHATPAEATEWLPKEHSKLTGVAVDAKALARVLDSIDSWPSETTDLFARTTGTGS